MVKPLLSPAATVLPKELWCTSSTSATWNELGLTSDDEDYVPPGHHFNDG